MIKIPYRYNWKFERWDVDYKIVKEFNEAFYGKAWGVQRDAEAIKAKIPPFEGIDKPFELRSMEECGFINPTKLQGLNLAPDGQKAKPMTKLDRFFNWLWPSS